MIRYDEFQPMIGLEPRKRVIGNDSKWHISERRCPKCGFRMACDGVENYLCNRCEFKERKDVRKYRSLWVREKRKNGMLYGAQSV